MERIKTHTYENNPEWNSLEINQSCNWHMSSLPNGEVEIACYTDNGSEHLYLDQNELKQVIAFLQTKVKQ